MKYSVALILLLAVASHAAVRTRRVRGRHNGSKVTNGIPAEVGQFPFQADVQGNGPFETFCAGVLIAPDWVLTDAACLDTATMWTVTVGMTVRSDTEDGRQVQVATEGYIHPDFDYFNYGNEIGIIRLPMSVAFTANVMPAVLPTRTEANGSYVGTDVTVSGWGWDSNSNQVPSDPLLYAKLTVSENTPCSDFSTTPNIVYDDKLCCESAFPINPCAMDDGAPMVTDGNKLLGLFMNFGGCETENPTLYIRVASYLDYIEEITGLPIIP